VSIQWLGTLPVAPISPTLNQAYYSSTDGKSYVWDGDSWELLAQDGEPGPAGPLTPGAAGQTLRHDGSTWVASGLLTNNGTNVGVNTDAPTRQLDVNGDQRLRGQLYDNTNLAGNSGQFLGNNGSGILWQNLPEGLHGTGEAGTMAIWEGSGSLAGLPNMTFSSSLSVVGSPTANPDDPIFEVKNSAGEIIFGVYQEGVRINIKDGAITKGLKGGFAVGGLTNQTKAGPVEYLRITPDSARIYVKQTPTAKGLKGGFAVGGLTNQTKGVVSQDMLFVAPDSARIYVKEAGTKGVKGGFAVGGLTNQTKAPNAQFLTLTPDNYLIGYEAGKSITTGLYNSFMGYQNGYSNTTGYMNYFIGYRAGYNNLSGYSNVFIGDSAGFNNTSGYKNIVIGNKSGFSNVAGKYNVFLGYNAGYANNADYNVFLGYEAGKNNTSGITNSFVGYQAGYSNTTGEKNVANGYQALYSNTGGSFNTATGNKALYSNANGQSNTATGSYSLNSNTSGSGNIAYGAFSLQSNTNGGGNSACGYSALSHNTIGNDNTAIGNSALLLNDNGNYNSALGSYALNKNSSGSYNIANGYNALFSNTTGNSNIAIGVGALYTTTGNGNIAVGYQTLYQNNTGYSNVASGNSALYNNKAGHDNVAIGDNAGQGASNIDFIQCTFVGAATNLTTARTNVTMLGAGISNGQCTADNQVLLGSTAVSQIRAQVSSITAYSDARMKFNVKDDVKGLDFIMKLKPVTYNEDPTLLHRIWGTPDSLLKNMDHSQIKKQRFIGFLAQDVEKAAKESGFDFPGIDVPKNEKEVYSLRYVDFIMPLIKGMQEQQQMINEQKTMINEQHKRIEQLEEEINKLKELMMK
jgi:hypothetical protein